MRSTRSNMASSAVTKCHPTPWRMGSKAHLVGGGTSRDSRESLRGKCGRVSECFCCLGVGEKTWPIIRDLVDDIAVVSEAEIATTMKLMWERMKLVRGQQH